MDWNILGTVSKEIKASDGNVHSYKIETDQGQTLTQNVTHVHHSEMADKENKEEK